MTKPELHENHPNQPCSPLPSESTPCTNAVVTVCLETTKPAHDTSEKNDRDSPEDLTNKRLPCADDLELNGFDPDSEEIRRVRWKVDRRLISMLSLIYLCCYLDRVNLGNAKVANLEADLNLSSGLFNMAGSIFYVGYILGEIPTNLAGFAPTPIFLISLWYPRREHALRAGIFFSMSAVAGAFGGLLAYGISNLQGVGGLRAWQWIFLLEGLFTVACCIIVYLVLPDFPETSTFLSPAEKDLNIKRLKYDAGPATSTAFSWPQFWAAFKDWKVYMIMFISFLHSATFAAIGLFAPSITLGFGFK
ncbi:hypothetical protein BGZ75_003535 [Mortierella antarctica]|nr:hypothetical protein BGZ75_003535 [Mortierella antarctica]